MQQVAHRLHHRLLVSVRGNTKLRELRHLKRRQRGARQVEGKAFGVLWEADIDRQLAACLPIPLSELAPHALVVDARAHRRKDPRDLLERAREAPRVDTPAAHEPIVLQQPRQQEPLLHSQNGCAAHRLFAAPEAFTGAGGLVAARALEDEHVQAPHLVHAFDDRGRL